MKKNSFNILGLNVSSLEMNAVIVEIWNAFERGKRLLVAPITSHSVVVSRYSANLKKIYNSVNLLVCDSQYLRWSLWFLYGVKMKDRVYGPKLFIETCRMSEKMGLKMYLVGNDILRLKKKLLDIFPGLIMDGYDLKDKKVNNSILKTCRARVKRNKVDILVIGLGTPLQHRWMSEFLEMKTPIIAVGAAFDFVSGRQKWCPEWVGNIGMEWLFRFISSPKRLWKRYLWHGPVFILLVIRQKLFGIFNFGDKVV